MVRRCALGASLVLVACRSHAPSSDASPVASAPAPVTSSSVAPPASSAAKAGPPAKRLGALAWETKVFERPTEASRNMGYLRVGAVVEVEPEPTTKAGCPGGFYALATGGYVCVGPGTATLDLADEVVRAFARRPDRDGTLPYLYGIVRRAGPIYGRLPSKEEAEASEPGLDARMKEWLGDATENGAGFRADYWVRGAKDGKSAVDLWAEKADEAIPWFYEGGRLPPAPAGFPPPVGLVLGKSKHHNGFAFLDVAARGGRRYAITTSLAAVPIDRLRPIEGSSFHGVEIPRDVEFPFAFVRRDGAKAFAEEHGKLTPSREIPRREVVKLTGKQKLFGGRLHYQTSDGLWISDQYASRLDPAKRMPKWGKKGERWIDVNVTKQTLVAYEGTKPVFATLVSTGEAGLGDPETSRSTKRGIFRIHTKHVTATMDSDVVGEEFELRDIPYVQYFEEGYALHAAYWHDDFGTPRSHGCINLAPADAKRLFFWTDPPLPEGWHGVRKSLTGSVVFVHP